jgi:hypothetical protein
MNLLGAEGKALIADQIK